MDIGRSSFIPKETAGMTPSKIRRRRTFNFFGFLATTTLIGSLIFAGGVYFFQSIATAKLQSAQLALNEQKSLFKPEDIAEVREFDKRLQAATELLRNHVAPLKIFAALEENTKKNIQLTSFTLEHTPSLEMVVSIEGTTPEFKTLALQELQFADTQLLRDIVFKEVKTVDDENATPMITFSLEGVVDTSLVHYDGTPTFIPAPTAFIEVNDTLSAVEGEAVVLGDSVSREEI